MSLFRSLTATQRGIVIALLSAVVFGLWPPAVRGIYQEGGNPSFALIVTTWVRTLGLTVFCFATGKRVFASSKDIRIALTGAFFQSASIIALFVALNFVAGPVVIIILFSHTLMLLLFMAMRGEVKLDIVTCATTAAALGGLVLVLDIFHQKTEGSIVGYCLAFTAALATVSRLYVFGKQVAEKHPIVVGAEIYLVTACLVSLLALYDVPHAPHTLVGLGYTTLGSVVLTLGTFGMFYGISLLGSFRWSLLLKLEPIFTALFSALILGEFLKTSQYLGICVVIASLVTYQAFDSRRKARLEAQKQMLSQ